MGRKPTSQKKPAVSSEDRVETRGRKKGGAKTGGRKKGTPNKVTASLRSRLEKQMDPFIDTLGELIAKIMDPKERLQAITSILPYMAPKLQSIDMKSEEEHNVTVEQYLVSLDEKFSKKKEELETKKVKLVSFD